MEKRVNHVVDQSLGDQIGTQSESAKIKERQKPSTIVGICRRQV
jgi:hypothetical protein